MIKADDMKTLALLFSSRVKAEVFRLLFSTNRAELYLRDMARRADFSVSAMMQELRKLTLAGIVLARKDGNRTYYRSNQDHPFYAEISGLVRKTELVEALGKALGTEGIESAFVFGSFATGAEKPDSDIDVMIVGSATLREIAKRLRDIQSELNREINPVVYSPQEFTRRLKARDHFLTQVMKQPRLVIKGSTYEFERLGK